MSTNLPNTIPTLINWANTHLTQFQNNQAQIGLTVPQVVNFEARVQALNDANNAAQAARQASKDATLVLNDAVSEFKSTAGSLINVIKAFAEASGNQNVYSLAGISPNAAPGVVPPPVPPQEFAAGVNSDGSLTLRWKVAQPAGATGVQYYIYRAVNGAQAFVFVGSSGREKSFIDATLPFGVDRVDYMIQPRRGEVIGAQSNTFTLRFGSVGGGGVEGATLSIASATEESHAEPVKIAA